MSLRRSMKNHFRRDSHFLPSSNHLCLFPLDCQSFGQILTTFACGLGNGDVSNGVLRSSLSSATFDSTSSASSFIGFSWGPLSDAFPPAVHTGSADPEHEFENRNTPNLIPLPT